MTDLKQHVSSRSAASLVTSRFSEHPERYFEIFRVLRKYQLHHIGAALGMTHQHPDEDELLLHQTGSAPVLAAGVLAGSLLIGGGQVLSALIRTGAIGKPSSK